MCTTTSVVSEYFFGGILANCANSGNSLSFYKPLQATSSTKHIYIVTQKGENNYEIPRSGMWWMVDGMT